MNLFLLLAVPLFSLILWRRTYPQTAWSDVRPTAAFSLVWSLILLVITILLSGWVIDSGNTWTTALGDVLVSAALIPGTILTLHLVPTLRPKATRTTGQRQFDVFVLLSIVLSGISFGEFLSTSRQSSAWELFLVPVVRLVWLAWLPWLACRWWNATSARSRALHLTGIVLLALCVPILHAFWLNGWGWLAAAVLTALVVTVFVVVLGVRFPTLAQKKAAPFEGGPTNPETSGE